MYLIFINKICYSNLYITKPNVTTIIMAILVGTEVNSTYGRTTISSSISATNEKLRIRSKSLTNRFII